MGRFPEAVWPDFADNVSSSRSAKLAHSHYLRAVAASTPRIRACYPRELRGGARDFGQSVEGACGSTRIAGDEHRRQQPRGCAPESESRERQEEQRRSDAKQDQRALKPGVLSPGYLSGGMQLQRELAQLFVGRHCG